MYLEFETGVGVAGTYLIKSALNFVLAVKVETRSDSSELGASVREDLAGAGGRSEGAAPRGRPLQNLR